MTRISHLSMTGLTETAVAIDIDVVEALLAHVDSKEASPPSVSSEDSPPASMKP